MKKRGKTHPFPSQPDERIKISFPGFQVILINPTSKGIWLFVLSLIFFVVLLAFFWFQTRAAIVPDMMIFFFQLKKIKLLSWR